MEDLQSPLSVFSRKNDGKQTQIGSGQPYLYNLKMMEMSFLDRLTTKTTLGGDLGVHSRPEDGMYPFGPCTCRTPERNSEPGFVSYVLFFPELQIPSGSLTYQ